MNMLTGKGASGKIKKKQRSQCDKEKSGESNHVCNEAKIIPQNLYAI